jgi:hypothetical protein
MRKPNGVLCNRLEVQSLKAYGSGEITNEFCKTGNGLHMR